MFNDLEIRVLICKRDVEMGLNMVKSLRKYNQFKTIPIYFHDDGSLDNDSKSVLQNIENSTILDKQQSDSSISEYITGYTNSERYRLENSRICLWHKIKLFDFYFFSKSKNILCIDTDILFLNEPKGMVDLIEKSIPFYFPDFQSSYSFSKNTQINVLEKVNTGIFYIPTQEYYNINSIEFALNDLFKLGIYNTPNWIEQSAYSHMFYNDGRYIKLNEEKYQIPTPHSNIPTDIESLHFVSDPPIRQMYNDFLKIKYL